jgi:hypothetical protein
MEAVLSFFQSFFTNKEYLVQTVWVAFGCVVAWFLLFAKRTQEITINETEILWKSHKQFMHCAAEKFTEIRKGTSIIGYVCQCGHEHKQDCPIINFG